jgi:hypothetical protein
MSRKGKMSAAEKQRRRERRAARRRGRVARRSSEDQERREARRADAVFAGYQTLARLRERAEKVHRERRKERVT